MKNNLLLPHRFKKIGWLIFLIATLLFIGFIKFEWQPAFLSFQFQDGRWFSEVNLLKEIIFTFWMIGLSMISFSKEKEEDEFISFLRLSSWQYAVIFSLIISLVGTLGIYGSKYLTFTAFNMLTVPLAFIIVFNVSLYKIRKRGSSDEK